MTVDPNHWTYGLEPGDPIPPGSGCIQIPYLFDTVMIEGHGTGEVVGFSTGRFQDGVEIEGPAIEVIFDESRERRWFHPDRVISIEVRG